MVPTLYREDETVLEDEAIFMGIQPAPSSGISDLTALEILMKS